MASHDGPKGPTGPQGPQPPGPVGVPIFKGPTGPTGPTGGSTSNAVAWVSHEPPASERLWLVPTPPLGRADITARGVPTRQAPIPALRLTDDSGANCSHCDAVMVAWPELAENVKPGLARVLLRVDACPNPDCSSKTGRVSGEHEIERDPDDDKE